MNDIQNDSRKLVAKRLLEVIPPVMHILRTYLRVEASSDLSIPQFRILANINRGLNTIGKIAQHHGVSQPAMSKMVDGLEVRGLIKRSESSIDKRVWLLDLTPSGRKLFQKLKLKSEEQISQKLGHLSNSQLEEIMGSLRSLEALINDIRREEL